MFCVCIRPVLTRFMFEVYDGHLSMMITAIEAVTGKHDPHLLSPVRYPGLLQISSHGQLCTATIGHLAPISITALLDTQL